MAIPGTPEYHREFMAKRREQEAAAAAAAPKVSPASVGLDVPVREVPVTLARPSLTVEPVEAELAVSRAPRRAEPRHGADEGVRILTSAPAAAKQTLPEAARASMRARGLTPSQELAAAEAGQAQQYEDRARANIGLQGAQEVSSYANPDYPIVKQYVETSTSINDRAMQAQQAIDDAEMLRAAKVADFMDEQNARQAEAVTDMRARQFHQEEAAMQAQERSKAAYNLVAKTTERLADAPDIDPGRWWASRSTGQKVAGFVAMLGRGLGGGGNPADWLMEHIDRDIAAQKASFDQKATAAGAAQQQGAMARGLYSDIRAQTQDEREADEIMRIAKLERAKAEFESLAARSAIPSVMAQQQQTRLQLEQAIADRRMQLDKLAAHNVKRKTVVSKAYRAVKDPVTGEIYRVPVGGAGDVALAKYDLEQAGEARKDARKVLGEETIEGVKAGNKAREETLKSKASNEQEAFKQLQKFGESTAAEQELLGLIDGFIAKYQKRGGVPGRGASRAYDVVMSPNETAEADAERVAIKDALGRIKSGGAITGDELDTFSQMVDVGFGDDQLFRNLRNIQRGAQIRLETKERGLSDEARAAYRRVGIEGLPAYAADVSDARDPTLGATDDAAALGGVLR